MQLIEFLPPNPHPLWSLCPQMGITGAVVKCAPELTGRAAPWDRDSLAFTVGLFEKHGLRVVALEGDQFDMSRIKMGLPGRDEDFELYIRMLENMAEMGITFLCYNFMAGTGWFRSAARPGRGGALCTAFSLAEVPETLPGAPLEPEALWDNYSAFLRAVLPTAERLGIRMGLHPDDPPLRNLGGIARIFGTVADFDRAYQLMPCRANAVTFCQANFKLGGADLFEAARHFNERIAYIHVRDVRGTAENFVELFHDEAETDFTGLFELYRELSLDVPLRCDHVPTMFGEGDEEGFVPGYGTLGRLFANGYLLGLLQKSPPRTPPRQPLLA